MMIIEVPEGYEQLGVVLQLAIHQAALGKGKSRHACGEPFGRQKICRISRAVGVGFALGQAEKKIEESQRIDVACGLEELLGAINYTAAGYLVMSEGVVGVNDPLCSDPAIVPGSLCSLVGKAKG